MAGSNPGFNQTEFREAIRFAMTMGAPTDTSERVVFHWKRDQTFTPADSGSRPYDFTAAPVTDEPGNEDEPDGELTVDCAVEFVPRTAEGTENFVGAFQSPRAIITLLDEDYARISDADWVTINDAYYIIEFAGPPMGMFEVTVYQIFVTARDEA